MKKNQRSIIAVILSLCLLLSGIYFIPQVSKGAEVTENTTPKSTGAADVKNVLFIGNSMTYYNTLCKVVEGFAKIQGKEIECKASTEGGKNLIFHTTYSQTVSAIQSGKYDVVVLQDIVGTFNGNDLLEGAEKLNQMIKQYNPSARVILYMPWPTQNRLTGILGRLPYFTYHYIKTANSIGAALAPAGEAWYTLVEKYPNVAWYTDGKHPHAIGTFVSACAVYYAMFPEESQVEINDTNYSAVNEVINKNIAYSKDAPAQYDMKLLNDISYYGYYYTRAVEAAVEDTTKRTVYRSVAGDYSEVTTQANIPEKIKVGKTKVKKAVRKSSVKKIMIRLKKVKGAKRYQIQISTTKKFKKKTVKKIFKKVKATVKYKKLKGSKLYVRARAVKIVNGEKYFSKWSKPKKVKNK